jgi:very-short-patch-repair endonuclease
MGGAPPAPDLGVGGAPGAAPTDAAAPPAGAPPAAAPAPTASSMLTSYRLASEIVNSIYQDRLDLLNKSDKVRTASKKIKSSAHEGFLMSLRPVTGRASLGPLADEYDGLFGVIDTPFVGGSLSYPLNNYAINELQSYSSSQNDSVKKVVAKKLENINQPKMFTSLEKKLYGLLMSLNMPFPLYAQYSAGPTFDYQLDAAIPNLKIGLEADGEIWHNNPDKIAKDKRRDSELAVNGWVIVRFTDKELQDHPQDCLNVLINAIKKRTGQSSDSNGEKYL